MDKIPHCTERFTYVEMAPAIIWLTGKPVFPITLHLSVAHENLIVLSRLGAVIKELIHCIISQMYNWSIDEAKFKKRALAKYKEWRLLQLINYGLQGEKLNLSFLKKSWPKIKNQIIDQWVRKYLEEIVLDND